MYLIGDKMKNETQQIQNTNAKTKTYTERFQEMETQLASLVRLYNEANQAFSITASIIQDISTQVRLLNDQLQAVYDLSERGVALTRQSIAEQINTRRIQKIQAILDKDEAAGIIKKIESVQTENDIIVYESEDISMAFKAAAAFESDGLKMEALIGKKVGDSVGSIKVKQIYQIIELKAEGQPNEQTQ